MGDSDFAAATEWARLNTVSFSCVTVIDIQNYSLPHDEIAVFDFGDPVEAALFSIAWNARAYEEGVY